MKFIKPIIIFPIIFFLFIVIPVGAQIQYNLLEPEVVDGTNNQYSNFIPYAINLVNTILTLAVLLSIVVFAYGAISYMFSAVPGIKTESSERMRSAIWGLLIALSAWLILWTINPDLIEFKIDLGQTGVPSTNNPSGLPINTNRSTTDYTQRLEGVGWYGPVPANEFEVREELRSEGFTINDDDVCKEGDVRNCRTYVGGLTDETKQGTIDLMDDCKTKGYDCKMRISAAAEQGGHSSNSSHYTGRAIDISHQGTDKQYFENLLATDFYPPSSSSYGDIYRPKNPDSNIEKIINEGDHYHIEFKK